MLEDVGLAGWNGHGAPRGLLMEVTVPVRGRALARR